LQGIVLQVFRMYSDYTRHWLSMPARTFVCCEIIKNRVLLSYSTQLNPSHGKLQNLDPTRPNPTQPAGRPNPWATLEPQLC